MPDMVLLAAKFDWVETLIPIIIFGVWIISQVLAVFRKVAKAPEQAVRQPQIRRVPPPPARPDGGQGQPPELEREIEELLRRTLGVEPVRQQEPPPPPPRPPKQQKQPQPVGLPASRLGDRSPSGGDIARHVEEAFAHDLAHESPSGTARQGATAAAQPSAVDLITALRSPEDLRRLMIVREILDVPTHRW
jgi:hypothetical protein